MGLVADESADLLLLQLGMAPLALIVVWRYPLQNRPTRLLLVGALLGPRLPVGQLRASLDPRPLVQHGSSGLDTGRRVSAADGGPGHPGGGSRGAPESPNPSSPRVGGRVRGAGLHGDALRAHRGRRGAIAAYAADVDRGGAQPVARLPRLARGSLDRIHRLPTHSLTRLADRSRRRRHRCFRVRQRVSDHTSICCRWRPWSPW